MDVAQLEVHLRNCLEGRVRDLRLLVRDGGIVLQGQTRTYYAKQLAQHAVMEAHSGPLLANEIEVLNASAAR